METTPYSHSVHPSAGASHYNERMHGPDPNYHRSSSYQQQAYMGTPPIAGYAPSHQGQMQSYQAQAGPPPPPEQQGSVQSHSPVHPLPDQMVPMVQHPEPEQSVYPSPPTPKSHSMVEMGRKYALEVVQQPTRARMCGFGDKDRRPITPPPCIRLVVTDAETGAEINTNDIEYGLFVLNVDLWSYDGRREMSLVRHLTNSPAISSTMPTSYANAQSSDLHSQVPVPIGTSPATAYPPQYGPPGQQPAYSSPYTTHPQGSPYDSQHQYQNTMQSPYGQSHSYEDSATAESSQNPYYSTGQVRPGSLLEPSTTEPVTRRIPISTATSQNMFTRNLIGNLSASACRLEDTNKKIGIWFVLQDLSVRTEGLFRLRFSFCNVGAPALTPNGNPANQISIVNTGKVPVLASCFSDVFTVYSAKKFPGVVESTPLSKCFAAQGIKIPIRKDGGNPQTENPQTEQRAVTGEEEE